MICQIKADSGPDRPVYSDLMGYFCTPQNQLCAPEGAWRLTGETAGLQEAGGAPRRQTPVIAVAAEAKIDDERASQYYPK